MVCLHSIKCPCDKFITWYPIHKYVFMFVNLWAARNLLHSLWLDKWRRTSIALLQADLIFEVMKPYVTSLNEVPFFKYEHHPFFDASVLCSVWKYNKIVMSQDLGNFPSLIFKRKPLANQAVPFGCEPNL